MSTPAKTSLISKIRNTKLTSDHYYYITVIIYFITAVVFTSLLGTVAFINTPQGFMNDVYIHGRDKDLEYKNSIIVAFILLAIQTFILSVKLGSKEKNIFLIISMFISFVLFGLTIFLYIIPENNKIFKKNDNTSYNYPAFILAGYLLLSTIYILVMFLNKKNNNQVIKGKFLMSDLGDSKAANLAEQRIFFPVALFLGALIIGFVGFLAFCIAESKYLFNYERTNIPSGMGTGVGKT